jgi:beta-N-acetylhexosaminidase
MPAVASVRIRWGVLLATGTMIAASCAGATRVTVDAAASGAAPSSGGSSSLVAASTTVTTALQPVECRSELTTEQKVGQVLMVLVSDPSDAAPAVAAGQATGYALIGNQSDGVGTAVAAVNAAAPLPVFAAGDEEGGSVQRLRNVLGRLPSAREIADTSSPEEAATMLGDYAIRMRELGLNMNLGPSVDVGTGSGLGNRTFSDDVDTVASYAVAVSAAMREAGVTPVPKHWPGLGSGDADPHQGATVVDDIEALRTTDLVVFDRLIEAGVGALMVGHAVIPGLTGDRPASLSSAAITDELRGREGFGGVIITDSLGMGAVSARFDNPHAAREALIAGADVALLSGVAFVPEATKLIMAALDDGTLPVDQLDESVDRVLRLKGIEGPCPLPEGG